MTAVICWVCIAAVLLGLALAGPSSSAYVSGKIPDRSEKAPQQPGAIPAAAGSGS